MELPLTRSFWPTGLLDPEVEIRPSENNLDDLLLQIHQRISLNERILVTTLTKKSAESLDEFMSDNGIRARTLHSDVKTADRVGIINGLRAGEFDVLIGINLLREGLDIPEVSLVVVLNADHAGFLRSVQALVQIMGRAARNANGKAILYADRITPAMEQAMDESAQRRERQIAYNQANGITPTSSKRKQATDKDEMAEEPVVHSPQFCENLAALCHQITLREKAMLEAFDSGEQTKASQVRKELSGLYRQFIFM